MQIIEVGIQESVLRSLTKQHPMVLIVGGRETNFAPEHRKASHRFIFWDTPGGACGATGGRRAMPLEVGAVLFTRFIGHSDQERIDSLAHEHVYVAPGILGTGIIRRILKAVIRESGTSLPMAKRNDTDELLRGYKPRVDAFTTQTTVAPVQTVANATLPSLSELLKDTRALELILNRTRKSLEDGQISSKMLSQIVRECLGVPASTFMGYHLRGLVAKGHLQGIIRENQQRVRAYCFPVTETPRLPEITTPEAPVQSSCEECKTLQEKLALVEQENLELRHTIEVIRVVLK